MNPQSGKVSVFVLHGPQGYPKARRMFVIDSYRPETARVSNFRVDSNNNMVSLNDEVSYPIETARWMYRSCLSNGWKPVT